MNEFMCRLDLGIRGYQDVEVSYEADGYKPLGFEVWMHDFPYFGKSSEITDFLTDEASDEIYEICRQHLVEYNNGGEP